MPNLYAFAGGKVGAWRVLSVAAVRGETLGQVDHLDIRPVAADVHANGYAWCLQGQISNVRYATRAEVTSLRANQEPLGRAQARRAALIPIQKADAWWDLAQDERRAIFEEQSHHTDIGLRYLPAIARQLYHCRDLGQPFDFLTWFEYAPDFADAFEELVAKLRASPEWQYVSRESTFGSNGRHWQRRSIAIIHRCLHSGGGVTARLPSHSWFGFRCGDRSGLPFHREIASACGWAMC